MEVREACCRLSRKEEEREVDLKETQLESAVMYRGDFIEVHKDSVRLPAAANTSPIQGRLRCWRCWTTAIC